MLINFLQIAFFNQYILSPKTWIHSLPSNLKITLTLIYLFILPYIHYKYIIIPTMFYFIFICNSKIPKSYNLNIEQTLCILVIYFFSNYINSTQNHNTNIQPLNQDRDESICRNINVYKMKTAIAIMPQYFIRSINIYIIYIALLKTLYLTTKYEDIIKCSLLIHKNSNKNFFIIQNQYIILLGSQFVILLINKINISIKAINLRGSKYQSLYYYIVYNLIHVIHKDIQRVSSTLYYRELMEASNL